MTDINRNIGTNILWSSHMFQFCYYSNLFCANQSSIYMNAILKQKSTHNTVCLGSLKHTDRQEPGQSKLFSYETLTHVLKTRSHNAEFQENHPRNSSDIQSLWSDSRPLNNPGVDWLVLPSGKANPGPSSPFYHLLMKGQHCRTKKWKDKQNRHYLL